MQICSDGHDEVCFSSDTCPACQFKNQIKEADEECSAALANADELKGTIDDLNHKLAEAQGQNPTNTDGRLVGWRL